MAWVDVYNIHAARILIYNLHVLHGCILSWNCWNMQSGSIPPGDHLQPCTDQLRRWVVVQIQIHKCKNTQIQITKYKSFCTDESDQQKMGSSWTVKWLLLKFNVSLCSFMSWTILLAQRCGVLCNGQLVLLCAAKMHRSVASCMYIIMLQCYAVVSVMLCWDTMYCSVLCSVVLCAGQCYALVCYALVSVFHGRSPAVTGPSRHLTVLH